MIDLHLHTTASDGRLTPTQLVTRAGAAGLKIIAVTDHDTTAGLGEASGAAAAAGLTFVSGIEITAIEQGQDIHILGYFFEPHDRQLAEFLGAQRTNRVKRVQRIADRLHALGVPIDTTPLLERARQGVSVGRPHVADALVAAGHAADRTDAFDRLIGRGRPAFVERCGASAAEVVGVIRGAGGLASLAHPGLTRRDDLLPSLVDFGLGAVEVRHSDHDIALEAHYRSLAAQHGLAVTGGSDYHGDGSRHSAALGGVTLPEEDFIALRERVR